MLFLIFMVLNISNFIQRNEQVLIELDISAIEDYIIIIIIITQKQQFQGLADSIAAIATNLKMAKGNWNRNQIIKAFRILK